MHWFFVALTTAICLSTADAISKKALKHTDEDVIVWVREGYALPFLLIPLFFIEIPTLDTAFYITVLTLLPLEILALLLYVRAINISPLSLTVPFMALSPVFIILIGYVTLGELPDTSGALGIIAIAAGAYMLNAGAAKDGLLGPIKAIFREKGSVLMIIVAFIYSITSTFGKVAVSHSSPLFFAFFYPLILTAALTVYILKKGKFAKVFEKPAYFVPIGLFVSIMIITHFIAITMTDVAYMIAVKRTSLLFSVIYGKLLFKEEKTWERLLGAAIMILGIVLITVF
ncbi:MAG: EamA family transporter [Deltaproteobacteria bacterium]|nr:EamA family transporter [Deltaproteobacteria bacterium]